MFLSTLLSALVLLSLNKADGVYQSGDTVRVFATENDVTTLVHEKVYEGPQTVKFEYADTEIGWVVEPQAFKQAIPCPKDFDKFWNKQKKQMRAIPMNPTLKEIHVEGKDNEKFVCYEMTIDCVDNTPVRGYLAMPRDAKKKSLPIVVYMHAAGVSGAWCRSVPSQTMDMAAWGNGAICVDFNAFGMFNDREQQYYIDLENGELKDYSRRPSDSPETFFFKNMYLRAVRALDFACTLKEWDGKKVLAYGQSQGGAQAFALAGLDKRVSAVVGIVPAWCNSAGSITPAGEDSWPFVFKQFATSEQGISVMKYFDGCNFLARSKAKFWVEIGLMDRTCLPSAIYAGLNVCPSKDITVKTSPYRYHDEPKPRYWKEWSQTIGKGRYDWINEYLK